MRIKLHKGLDLQIPGEPRQSIDRAREPKSVALLGHDHPRSRCDLRVSVGDRVRLGQPLFVDHQHPEICFTSPASGIVTTAQRNIGRQPISVVIEQSDQRVDDPATLFPECGFDETMLLDRAEVTRRILEAGEWPSLRARPHGDIAKPGSIPDAIFIRVMDTNPLAPRPTVVLEDRIDDFRIGVAAVARLTDGPVFVCCDPETNPSLADLENDLDRVRVVTFEGPHPAGLVGTHMHHLFPIRDGREVWYTAYQESLAIGHLFRTGRIDCERVIALAGPLVRHPRLLRTRLGANTEELIQDELLPGECRIISGSLLSGRLAATAESYLGRYHDQISVVPEGREEPRRSGRLRRLSGGRTGSPSHRGSTWTTAMHGRPRAMLPLHVFEDVVPLRIPITLLLRSLAAGDFEAARAFGALDLEEEDLALCSYLCPSKLEYGDLLRSALDELGANAA
jgi:Na+-transporting NADH:ubiquinone oxidoreductase subunit A